MNADTRSIGASAPQEVILEGIPCKPASTMTITSRSIIIKCAIRRLPGGFEGEICFQNILDVKYFPSTLITVPSIQIKYRETNGSIKRETIYFVGGSGRSGYFLRTGYDSKKIFKLVDALSRNESIQDIVPSRKLAEDEKRWAIKYWSILVAIILAIVVISMTQADRGNTSLFEIAITAVRVTLGLSGILAIVIFPLLMSALIRRRERDE